MGALFAAPRCSEQRYTARPAHASPAQPDGAGTRECPSRVFLRRSGECGVRVCATRCTFLSRDRSGQKWSSRFTVHGSMLLVDSERISEQSGTTWRWDGMVSCETGRVNVGQCRVSQSMKYNGPWSRWVRTHPPRTLLQAHWASPQPFSPGEMS